MTSIGDRIKAEREAAQLSQAALGKKAGVTGSAVSQWEVGKTKGESTVNFLRIASALNVRPEWLATGRGRKGPEVPNFDEEKMREAIELTARTIQARRWRLTPQQIGAVCLHLFEMISESEGRRDVDQLAENVIQYVARQPPAA